MHHSCRSRPLNLEDIRRPKNVLQEFEHTQRIRNDQILRDCMKPFWNRFYCRTGHFYSPLQIIFQLTLEFLARKPSQLASNAREICERGAGITIRRPQLRLREDRIDDPVELFELA